MLYKDVERLNLVGLSRKVLGFDLGFCFLPKSYVPLKPIAKVLRFQSF